MGPVPSVASLARIFRQAGISRLEPRKKPRSAWRRFVYPAPNACWQLDATEYALTGGRRCGIFELIDHSRYAVGSHVAWGETSEAAMAVFDKAVAAHGIPPRLLSDDGAVLNPSRRGVFGQLLVHGMESGVEPITGKPLAGQSHLMVDGQRAFEQVLVITDSHQITITDPHAEILIEHTRPAPGVTYVGNGRRCGPQPNNPELSPMS